MRVARATKISFSVLASVLSVFVASKASALPFNDDMVSVQKRTGVMMRQKAPGTVAIGMSEYHVASREEAEKMTNPIKGDARSTAKGKRLFTVNCLPCHGDIKQEAVCSG